MRYPYKETEEKWQKYWADKKVHKTNFEKTDNKLYTLVMFIYPSGAKLHCGHWYNYGPTDTWARYKKLKGFNVFEPMGYDAFGLPAENYAIQTGIHPQDSTLKNIEDIRKQLNKIGCMYDWDSELMTCDPKYYKWNQWLFLQLYKKGLAYRKKAPVNWCPKDQTVLANEQVQSDGTCERCGTTVIQKNLSQWFFKITDYAEELLQGLDKINWPDKTKLMQRNWIGKSVGAEVTFLIDGGDEEIKVFTTRPDTLFGVTYVVLAPEHPLVDKLTAEDYKKKVEEYRDSIKSLTEIERTSTTKEKTGVPIGGFAVNPVNNEKVPIWIADYALITYGTGCVMAVPGHDERDFEFAQKCMDSFFEITSIPASSRMIFALSISFGSTGNLSTSSFLDTSSVTTQIAVCIAPTDVVSEESSSKASKILIIFGSVKVPTENFVLRLGFLLWNSKQYASNINVCGSDESKIIFKIGVIHIVSSGIPRTLYTTMFCAAPEASRTVPLGTLISVV